MAFYYFVWPALAIGFMSADITYFVRGLLITICSFVRLRWRRKDIMEENIMRCICWTSDIDFLFHMNNARYPRETDFARMKLWIENGSWGILSKLGGTAVLGASTIRYRKSIQFLDMFTIKTKILCWDEKAVYVEHKFERNRDGFILAIMFAKQSFIKVSPSDVFKALIGAEIKSPEFPEEIKKWIECNQISSELLNKSL